MEQTSVSDCKRVHGYQPQSGERRSGKLPRLSFQRRHRPQSDSSSVSSAKQCYAGFYDHHLSKRTGGVKEGREDAPADLHLMGYSKLVHPSVQFNSVPLARNGENRCAVAWVARQVYVSQPIDTNLSDPITLNPHCRYLYSTRSYIEQSQINNVLFKRINSSPKGGDSKDRRKSSRRLLQVS